MRSNPLDINSEKLFYPRAVCLAKSVNIKQMTEYIKEISSLSRGDVRSVLQSFVEKLKEQLIEGKHVNIDGLGVFSLSLRSQGEKLKKELSPKSIDSVHICFKANKELQVSKAATRANEKLSFIRLEDYLKGELPEGEKTPDTPKDDSEEELA